MFALRTVLLLALIPAALGAGELRLEIEHRLADRPLAIGETRTFGGLELSVARLDYLLSGFALQRPGGEWIEADPALVGFVSAGRGLTVVDLGEVPSGEYRALRFHIGPGPQQNAADPNSFPPGHALHPTHCGLHWGWQGGYIFMALEGHFPRDGADGAVGGFSYHLAEDANRVRVEVEMPGTIAKRATAGLRFDVGKLFVGQHALSPAAGETSTHSRAGDPLPAKLRAGLGGAFEFAALRPELFHRVEPAAPRGATPVGERYDLRVSTRLPAFELPADNPPTVAGVALGRRLFEDPLLSRDGSVSCATCHRRELAFTDGRKVSAGIGGALGSRNAMPLSNLLWATEFFWDGHAPSLRSQVLEPIQDTREMGESLANVIAKLVQAEGYPAAFDAAFGGRGVTPDRIAKALEQFLLTLVSQDSRFDRAMRGELELTAQERRGFQLFAGEKDPKLNLHGADCFHCHGGSLFTNGGFANNGLELAPDDVGRLAVTKTAADRGKFKVPSLRNIALTSPYMHDGRFATLEQVIEHYDSGVHRSPSLDPNLAKHPPEGLGLSPEDKAALLAFLRALTDEAFLR